MAEIVTNHELAMMMTIIKFVQNQAPPEPQSLKTAYEAALAEAAATFPPKPGEIVMKKILGF